MVDDGFEELNELKAELSGRKSVPQEELTTLIKALSQQIVQLTEVFKLAISQMGTDDDELKKIREQLDLLIKNDQDLARGLLLVLEIEKDRRDLGVDRPMMQQSSQPMRRPMRPRFRARRPLLNEEMTLPQGPPLPPGPGSEMEIEFPENAQPAKRE